ncbi:Uncharacterized protein TPAR_08241 [Tolypocladium paradoxum]|uniref:Lipid droplet-associated hydrolase n=1 Tax=Tolypocladium paradoxum TaxID=94208 RepID=A0A2S4KMY5_9HYPO|nr:Uncharacterized protein TPAR_08241 [Tolypocladium paradoxum]
MLSSIWLPSGLRDAKRRALVYFVCGNPGLVGFYADFLDALRGMLDASEAEPEARTAYDVYGRNLLGFSDAEHEPFGPGRAGPWDLDAQVEAIYDDVAARAEHRGSGSDSGSDSGCGYDFVVLAGHSVGAYIAVDIFHRHARQPDRAPRLVLRHGLLLFPTIASIDESPSGRRMQLLRSLPTLDAYAHTYAWLALLPWPRAALCCIMASAMGFSPRAADVAAEWLKSRDGVLQALHMGKSELDRIREDAWGEGLWEASTEAADDDAAATPRFFLFYGKEDHWVAGHVRDDFIRRRRERGGRTSIAVDEGDIPHAFCTSEHNSWLVAKRVHGWIEEIERGSKA